MRQLAWWVAFALMASMSSQAAANGREKRGVSLRHQPGNNATILFPSTYGVLLSTDDGATFHWMCEAAVGYGGTFDPDFAMTAGGHIYAGVPTGLRVTIDGGCTWTSVSDFDNQFVSQIEVASDGDIWVAFAAPTANGVAKSTDGGTVFAPTSLSRADALWASLKVAPSDPDRAYATGYDVNGVTFVYRTENGGASWVELPITDFTFPNPLPSPPHLLIEAVSPADPDVLFARVRRANPPTGDAIYRSVDKGASWTKVLDRNDEIPTVLVRASGTTVVAAGPLSGVSVSTDSGASFGAASSQPQMWCASERADGVVFSCGNDQAPDFFTLGRSTDLTAWQPVLRLSQVAGPLSCAPGTVQHDTCEVLEWPDLADALGVGGNTDAGPGGDGGVTVDAGPFDGGSPDAGNGGDGGGCGGCGAALFLIVYPGPFRAMRRRDLTRSR